MRPRSYIAYFSMEIGLDARIPTYAGGLGALAGDTVRSAADLGIPMVAVSLLLRRGYFHQRLDETGWQTEEPALWRAEDFLTEMPARVEVEIKGHPVTVRCWRYEVKGVGGRQVPVFLLDTDVEPNTGADRTLTHYLYGGDAQYRLSQEAILGIGGVRMLRALGYTEISRYHMNEGHASLLVLELLAEQAHKANAARVTEEHVEAIRPRCVFTTHTPVPAGHDQFRLALVHEVLGPSGPFCDQEARFCREDTLNLTYLALEASHYINGVAKKHREVSQHMYAHYQIDSITNGVHVATWAADAMQALFDRHVAGWRSDNLSLRYAISIPKAEIREAHRQAKTQLIEAANAAAGANMSPDVFTIGFARRATQYKRFDLLFRDVERLRSIARDVGPLQILYAGKAHPHDQPGKEAIQFIHRMRDILRDRIRIAYLPNYDMALARLMTAGADLWLNTPQPPLEASGTSGMKAAINGVPSLSVLDGWWIEGCIEGITGWAIGGNHDSVQPRPDADGDAQSLYDKLERVVVPMYYGEPDRFIEVMRGAIALNASFFNTERMVNQYVTKAYFM